MANDLNSVCLCGRLTRDCGSDQNGKDFGYTQGGMCFAKISIAVNRSKKQGDQWVDEGHFFDIAVFGNLAQNLKPYLVKGKQVVVRGHLNQERWTDQNGNNRSKVGIIADEIQLVGGQSQNGNGQQGYQQQGQNYQQAPQQSYQPQPNFPPPSEGFPEDISF